MHVNPYGVWKVAFLCTKNESELFLPNHLQAYNLFKKEYEYFCKRQHILLKHCNFQITCYTFFLFQKQINA